MGEAGIAAFCTSDPVDIHRLFHSRVVNIALRSGLAGDLQASGGAGPILADGVGQLLANRAGGRQVSRLDAVAAGFALLVLLL
ncbi:hypothetical protein ACWV27_01280 [Massilia varians]